MLKSQTLNKEIPKLKITDQLLHDLNNIVETMNNEESEIKIGLAAIRRMALKDFVTNFYKDGLKIEYKINGGNKK